MGDRRWICGDCPSAMVSVDGAWKCPVCEMSISEARISTLTSQLAAAHKRIDELESDIDDMEWAAMGDDL